MLRVGAAVIATLCICCGGGDSADSNAPAENRPPVIESVAILPAAPSTADSLSLVARAQDPDRDGVELEVVWYRNGARYPNDGRHSVKPFSFDRGDRIHAVAHASDGKDRVSRRTDTIVIGNSVPQVTSIRLVPETALATDAIRALVEATDIDGDPIEYRYRWYVGDESLDVPGPELPELSAIRDDRVSLEVAGFDGTDLGPWARSDALRIGNSAPAITTQPAYTLNSEGAYQYAVNASDPDGDAPLKYELIDSPAGMRVDPASGVVTWMVPRDANGTYSIELSVSDPHGARTLQRYSLDLSWGSDPADTP